MDGDFPDPNYNMPPGGYGYPHEGFDYNQPMDYSHEAGYDFHHGDPSMQPLAHPPPRGGTWYDTDLWEQTKSKCKNLKYRKPWSWLWNFYFLPSLVILASLWTTLYY